MRSEKYTSLKRRKKLTFHEWVFIIVNDNRHFYNKKEDREHEKICLIAFTLFASKLYAVQDFTRIILVSGEKSSLERANPPLSNKGKIVAL